MSKLYFKVTVEGEYGYVNDSGVLMKNGYYKEVFELPNLDAPLSVIKNEMLDMRLRHNKKGYKRFRTHKIIHSQAIGGTQKGSLTREKLFEYNDLSTLKRFVKTYGLVLKENIDEMDIQDAKQHIADIYAMTSQGLLVAGNQLDRDLQARSELSLREELNSIYQKDSEYLHTNKVTTKERMIELIKTCRTTDEQTRELNDNT